MALMAIIGLGVVSFIVMENRSLNNKNSVRNNADAEIERAIDRIAAIMSSPAHCNANLRNRNFSSPYTTLTNIRECVGGNCDGTTGTPTPVMNMNNFVLYVGEPATKIRIVELSYELTAAQATHSLGSSPRPGYTLQQPAIATLRVVFEKNLGFTAGGVIKTVRTKPYTVDAFVVTSRFNYTTRALVPRGTGTIYGCARSPAATHEL